MKSTKTLIYILGSVVIGIGVVLFFFGRTASTTAPEQAIHQELVSPAGTGLWTCSMHPEVQQPEAGACPLCGMDLTPQKGDNLHEEAIYLSARNRRLAGITTTVVRKKGGIKRVDLHGRVVINEEKLFSQSAHFSGRIEDLGFHSVGQRVRQGEVVAYLYSPELMVAQEELLAAYSAKDSQAALYEAAKKKLSYWKLSEAQLTHLVQTGTLQDRFPLRARVSGVLWKKRVQEGAYVKRGAVLFDWVTLSPLWVQFEVYEQDLPWVREGLEVNFSAYALPGDSFSGTLDFIDPIVRAGSHVAMVRLTYPNKDEKLKPGMRVTGQAHCEVQPREGAWVVPKSAVLWTGKRSILYVEQETSAGVGFAMREVILAVDLGDSYLITKGLEGGEVVVTHGAFFLDAAAQLDGSPSMMTR